MGHRSKPEALATFETEMGKLRNSCLNEIDNFFKDNPNEKIDVEEIEGSAFTLFDKSQVDTISAEGVTDDSTDDTQEFSNLAIEDLCYVIDVINNQIDMDNKTIDKCRDNNF